MDKIKRLFTFANMTLLSALSLAATAGIFSVFGMMALFAGIPWVGALTGAVVEFGKLMAVSWLYRHWHDKAWFRVPLVIGAVTAMLVTSLGVFGMLSKAHTDQGAPVSNNKAKIEVIISKIDREQRKIDSAISILDQYDAEIAVLVKYNKITVKNGAQETRAKYKSQRDELESTIDESQEKIDEMQDERFELSQVVRDYEVEVGPVAAFASLVSNFYTIGIGGAVQIAIIMIMLALDPIAIMLLMAYNHIIMKAEEARKQKLEDLSEVYAEPEDDLSLEDLLEDFPDPEPEPEPAKEPASMVAQPDEIVAETPVVAEEEIVSQPAKKPAKKKNNQFIFDPGEPKK